MAHHHLFRVAAAASASKNYGRRGVLEPHGGLPFAARPVVYEYRLLRLQVNLGFDGAVGPVAVAFAAAGEVPKDGDDAIGRVGQLIKTAANQCWRPLSGWLLARLLNVGVSATDAVDFFVRFLLVGTALLLAGKVFG